MKWMPQQTVRFRIRQDGRVEESVEGVVGEACRLLTERIEESIGVVEPVSYTHLTLPTICSV